MQALADRQVGDDRGRDFQRIHQRHGTFAQDRQGAGKTRRFHGPQYAAHHRRVEQQPVPAQGQPGLAQGPAGSAHPGDQDDQQEHAVAAQPGAQGNHGLGEHRQGLAAVDENFHHVRDDIPQQKTDDGQRRKQQDHRVHQRQLDLLARGMTGFGVVSQLLKHVPQMTAAFARRDGGAEQRGERTGERRQRGGQRMAFHDTAAHRRQQAADLALVGLRGHGQQRFFKGQAGMHQRRQLAGQQGQIGHAQACAGLPETPRRAADAGFAHLKGAQAALAQALPRMPCAVSVLLAPAGAAIGVLRAIVERGHGQSSCVTRSSSSRLVRPSSTRRWPS